MRVVFAWCADAGARGFEEAVASTAVRDRVAAVTFRPRAFHARGPAAYLALRAEDLSLYEAWFPGLQVRVRARLQHVPLDERGAVYLPVTFDSWVVVCDGPAALGAGLEAAAVLKGVATVVCPAFSPSMVGAAVASVEEEYRVWQDRVRLKEASPGHA